MRSEKRSCLNVQKRDYGILDVAICHLAGLVLPHRVREKLKAGLYPEDLIEAAVTYVKSFGYLNDVRYAENFILARKSTKSKREILALLNRKGICSADIEKAFESCYGESEEVEAVRRILAKKKVDVRTADEREMQKIYGYLGRKGFRYDVVRQVIQNSIENA